MNHLDEQAQAKREQHGNLELKEVGEEMLFEGIVDAYEKHMPHPAAFDVPDDEYTHDQHRRFGHTMIEEANKWYEIAYELEEDKMYLLVQVDEMAQQIKELQEALVDATTD